MKPGRLRGVRNGPVNESLYFWNVKQYGNGHHHPNRCRSALWEEADNAALIESVQQRSLAPENGIIRIFDGVEANA